METLGETFLVETLGSSKIPVELALEVELCKGLGSLIKQKIPIFEGPYSSKKQKSYDVLQISIFSEELENTEISESLLVPGSHTSSKSNPIFSKHCEEEIPINKFDIFCNIN